LIEAVGDSDSAVRYWAVLGLLMREKSGVAAGHAELLASLDDTSPYVRVVVCEALARYGMPQDRERSLNVLMELSDGARNNVFVVMAALNAIASLADAAAPIKQKLQLLPTKSATPHARYGEYIARLLEELK
jgi:hypothetical protein